MRVTWVVVAGGLVGCAADTSSDVPVGTAEIAGPCVAVGGVWTVRANPVVSKRQSCAAELFQPTTMDFAANQTWMGMPCTLSGTAESGSSGTCNYTYALDCTAEASTGVVYHWQIDLERNESKPNWMVGTVHAETLRSGRAECESTWGVDLTR